MDESNEVQTEPSLERRSRRRFSGADKQRLVAEFETLGRGDKGEWLRRNGLYASQLANWRKTLAEAGMAGLEPDKGGRKPKDPRDRRIEELEGEKKRLEQRARVAEDTVDLQKKLFALIDDAHSESSQ